MSSRLILLAVALVFASSTVHAGRAFQPEALEGQRVKFEHGTGSVSSTAQRSFVLISYEPEAGCCGWLRVYISNGGDDPVDVSEQSASVSAGGRDMHVFTFAEVQKKLRRSARWAQFAAGLAMGLNSYSAGQAGYSQHSGTISGDVDARYSGTTYDSAAAQQAQFRAAQENTELWASVEQTARTRSADLRAAALQRTTLDPGEDVFGDIEIQLPRPVKHQETSFSVQIRVGEDVHEFKFVEDR